jgi:hypothetical protein
MQFILCHLLSSKGKQRPEPSFELSFTSENNHAREERQSGGQSSIQNKRTKIVSINPALSTSNNISNVLAIHRAKGGNSQGIPLLEQLSAHRQSLNRESSMSSTDSAVHSRALISHSSESPSSSESYHLRKTVANGTYRSRRRSMQYHTSQLGYYSPRSKSILRDAKMKYRIYIATEMPFPTTAQAFECASKKYNLSSDEYATDTETERENLPSVDRGRLQVVSFLQFEAYMRY